MSSLPRTRTLLAFAAWLLVSWPLLAAAPLPVAESQRALPAAIRGVWLTNVASDALYSRAGIERAVELCDELGINSIFVVTWNKGQTLYPSEIMKNLTGTAMDPALDPHHRGRDPLRELIDAAHARGIKVFAWFEFGFAASHGQQGGELVRHNPHWGALNVRGELVSKNGFEWLNALDQDVQQFMTSLVLEVVRAYDVDGVQGDDRLPALPSAAGYNPAVVAEYRKAFGKAPPVDYKDPQWVDWRARKLNQYAQSLYRAIKAEAPQVIVSFAPSVFPWSKQEYLQDWPSWLAEGSVDLLIPQVYRHDLDSYRATLQDTLQWVPKKDYARFSPGVLIKVGTQTPSPEMLQGMLQANRDAGFLGEVFFFYEGLEQYRDIIHASYAAQPVRFPAL